MASKKKRPPKSLWALFTYDGTLAGADYPTREAAEADAWGPAFRPSWSVREYRLAPEKESEDRR